MNIPVALATKESDRVGRADSDGPPEAPDSDGPPEVPDSDGPAEAPDSEE